MAVFAPAASATDRIDGGEGGGESKRPNGDPNVLPYAE